SADFSTSTTRLRRDGTGFWTLLGFCYTTMLPHSKKQQTMADFLDEKRAEIAKRLNELRPLVEEHRSLESAASALARLGPSAPSTPIQRRGRGRPAGPSAKKAAMVTTKPKRGPGRRKGS